MPSDIALTSPSKPPSQPVSIVVVAQTPITAQKILQMSHMELLYESTRADPRLRRLLGHVSTYENAHHWCLENKRNDIFYRGAEKEKAKEKRTAVDDSRRNGVSSTFSSQVQRFRTLPKFQVAMQLQPQHRRLVPVSPTEADADSDSSDSSDSESDSSNDDDDTRICSYNTEAFIERVKYMTKILLLKGGGNDNETDMSMYRCAK